MNLRGLHDFKPCTGRQAKRCAPKALQRFEIQMSTLVLFISGELLLRKVVDRFQKPHPTSFGDSCCQIDSAYQCVEFVLIMSDTLSLACSNFISYISMTYSCHFSITHWLLEIVGLQQCVSMVYAGIINVMRSLILF